MIESISMNDNSTLKVSTSTASAVQKNAQEKNTQAVVSQHAPHVPSVTASASDEEQTLAESSQGDILELSEKGVAQSKSVIQQAAASVVSSDSSETQDLSQYSAAELTKMVTSGTITQAEMNTELSDRKKSASEQTSADGQISLVGQTSTNEQTSTVKEQ